jgi:S-DNA-T family DNA segregation ATPase FtsK/SpoIIIE
MTRDCLFWLLRHRPALRSLRLGRVEDGTDYVLNLVATNVLVAGSTGAGKGSVVWSLVRLLTSLVWDGLVELWVVDSKGGWSSAPAGHCWPGTKTPCMR